MMTQILQDKGRTFGGNFTSTFHLTIRRL